VLLLRNAYFPDRTLGRLRVGDREFHTLERPWIESNFHKGGRNWESCIPDGEYLVKEYESEKRGQVWRLTNPDLDVFGNEPGMSNKAGRWDILIHAGNYVKDVVGCVAIGLTSDENHVWKSRAAIEELRKLINGDQTLHIIARGTKHGSYS
jgi:hypothetical protein